MGTRRSVTRTNGLRRTMVSGGVTVVSVMTPSRRVSVSPHVDREGVSLEEVRVEPPIPHNVLLWAVRGP